MLRNAREPVSESFHTQFLNAQDSPQHPAQYMPMSYRGMRDKEKFLDIGQSPQLSKRCEQHLPKEQYTQSKLNIYHILPLTHTHVYICTNHIFTTHINISLPLQHICTIPTHHIYIKYTTHTHHIAYTIYTIQLILSIRHACIHYQAIIQDFLYHTYTYTTYIYTHHTDTYTIHTQIHTTPYIQTLIHAIHVQYISHKYTLHPSIYAHTYILHAFLI